MSASPTERFQRVDAVFDAVLDLPADAQAAYIDRACGHDAELRAEVLELLRAYHESEGFLETPAVQIAAPLLETTATLGAAVPDRIGAFRLMREIGRGGMGTVFLAERADGQFDQRVALKLIQRAVPGLVRRFMEERRILALLEHPSIARLIDGGIAPGGLPYYAMELVDGEPIDEYCTQRALNLDQRLELFVRVCDAVGYAHQHLVIHRDLKPSNILVTPDGQVKLLDFGIAKLLDRGQAVADTTRTDFLVMTPEFAAPEQVRGAPVSTATDVYSLGVLLYILLTGERPYDVRGKMPSEIERIVCDVDPPRPSSTAATALQRRLRGDLDDIVMMALRKEPDRRYASVHELADDVRRRLAGRPVRARPQTAGYRARRFAHRHAWALAAASAIVLLASGYVVTILVQHARVERALAEATVGALKAEQVTDFMLGLFQASERGQAFADTLTARELLNRGIARARELNGQPEVQAQMLDAVAQIHVQLGEYDLALDVFDEALARRRTVLDADHVDVATSLFNVAFAAHQLGDFRNAIALRSQALDIRRRKLGNLHAATLEAIYWQATSLHWAGESDAARPLFDEWTRGIAALPAVITAERATQYVNLGQLLTYRGEYARAAGLIEQAIDIRRQVFGERHVRVATAISALAGVHIAAGDLTAAEQGERESLAMTRALYPEGHPHLADAIRSLAVVLHQQRRYDEAEQLYLERLELIRRFYGDDHMRFATASEDLALLNVRLQRYDRAEPYVYDAVRLYRARAGEQSLLTRRAEVLLGELLRGQGRHADAEPLLLAGFETFRARQVRGFEFGYRIAVEGLTQLYSAQGRNDEAARFRALMQRDSAR